MSYREVSFPVDGVKCVGKWWEARSDGLKRLGRAPTVVMGHGFAVTIDCKLTQYAERFSELGMHVLAFDYRCFGASEGQPRQWLSVSRQQEDWHAALKYVRSQTEVDVDRIALWGTSFGGGHVVPIAVQDGDVCAIVSQCPMMDGWGSTQEMIKSAGAWTSTKVLGKSMLDLVGGFFGLPPICVPVAGGFGKEGLMTTRDSLEGYGLIVPESWKNEVCARIGLSVGLYRPGRQADKLPCDILILACDDDSVAPVEGAIDAAKRAGERAVLRRYPIKHFEIYISPHVEKAMKEMETFLLARMS